MNPGSYLLSHSRRGAVSSALEDLTSGFGMGPGISPPVWPPRFPINLTAFRDMSSTTLKKRVLTSIRAHDTLDCITQEKAMRYLHTMLHVTDLQRSIRFYTEIIGLKVHIERENPEGRYTLVYLGYGGITEPFLELRYNWDTEEYEHGNAFGHIAFSVKDINEACKKIEEGGGRVVREPRQMKHRKSIVAFAEDPDSYTIELVQRPGKQATEQPEG